MTVGPVRITCPCGCDRYGSPRKRAWRDGLVHSKNCECVKYCQASGQKTTAMRREDRVARDSGGRRNPGSGAQGGMDLKENVWEIEETTLNAVVKGFRAWWEGKGVQQKVHGLMKRQTIGPRALILSWEGDMQMVVCPYPDWATVTLELEQARAELEMWRR